jgi:hypothetical protein
VGVLLGVRPRADRDDSTVVEGTRSPGRIAIAMTADAIGTSAALGEQTVDFALPTHLHWDHVCGLLDLPSVPVHVHEPELDWITTGEVAPVGGVRDALRDRAGHTPGSVGILVNTASGWVLLAGDAAWHTLQIENIRQKSSYPGVTKTVTRAFAACTAFMRSRTRCASFPHTTTRLRPRCSAAADTRR